MNDRVLLRASISLETARKIDQMCLVLSTSGRYLSLATRGQVCDYLLASLDTDSIYSAWLSRATQDGTQVVCAPEEEYTDGVPAAPPSQEIVDETCTVPIPEPPAPRRRRRKRKGGAA